MPVVSFTVGSDHRFVATEVVSQRMIEWVVRVADQPHRARAPLNLALVLDRSGSMDGDKLRYVKQAAAHVLDLLDARDRVAVVAYDDQVRLIGRSEHVSEQVRQHLKAQINQLQPGGWTDLSGGWLQGCQQIAAYQMPEGINRALLLTDGLANRGIVDVEELMQHAYELRRRGITTSAFGVGLDFNEHLLEQLATRGNGHFYYIERPDQIPGVFRSELGELLSVVAREVFLTLEIPRGVRMEVLGDLPHERQGDLLRIFLGDMRAGEQRWIYARALTPPDTSGTHAVLRTTLGYADLDGITSTSVVDLGFSYMNEAEVIRVPADRELLRRSSEIELATAQIQALRMEKAGLKREAVARMRQTLASVAPYAPSATVAEHSSLADQMEEEDGLTELERKKAQFKSYQKRQSRE